jgi:hypothetical protein
MAAATKAVVVSNAGTTTTATADINHCSVDTIRASRREALFSLEYF